MAAGNENNAWINGVKLMTAEFHWNVSQAGMFSALCLHNVLLYTGEKWQNQDMKERQLSETLQCPLGWPWHLQRGYTERNTQNRFLT